MRFDPGYAIQLTWLIFLAYWILAGLRVNKMERSEPAGERAARILAILVAFILLYDEDPRCSILGGRFIPERDWIFATGSALTFAGVAFAIWARYHTAQYWSASVVLRAGHQLIRTGPYARIRHPIYTGMLQAVAGTALAIGRYRALAAFAIILAGFIWKSKREEKLLGSQFGSAFDEHRRHLGFILPRFS